MPYLTGLQTAKRWRQCAIDAAVPFTALWLEAPISLLFERVASVEATRPTPRSTSYGRELRSNLEWSTGEGLPWTIVSRTLWHAS